MKKNFRTPILLALIVIGGGMVSLRLPVKEDYFEMSKQLEILNSAFRELNIFYVDPLSPGDLMKTGIEAILESLDPYTRYYPESKMEDVRFMSTGEYGGVGLSLGERWDGTFFITDIQEGSPAEISGLRLGDNLVEINGQTVSNLNMKKIGELIKGTSGTDIELGVSHANTSEIVTFSITRQKIKRPDVPYYGMISDSTGYLILSKFTRTASVEVRKALIQLTDSMGAKQIVFDLRGNGGGLLREAVNIVNLFVPKGQEVVSMRGKTADWNKNYGTTRKALLPDIPLVILMDDRSASASEIVAGTLQDLDRAVIIGQESFGKGLVQQTKKLAYGSRIKITVAKYYTASGRCVQRLHYDDKNSDGNATIQADSTLKTFYTNNGRPVIEGRGVIPDIEILPEDFGFVVGGIMNSELIFDFVVHTINNAELNNELAEEIDAKGFGISDKQWNEFVEFALQELDSELLLNSKRKFPYESNTTTLVSTLEKTMADDGFLAENTDLVSKLKSLVEPNLEEDLSRNEETLRDLISEEMIFHYKNTSGVFIYSLPKDAVALSAVSTLEGKEYLKVLGF
ncbi:MAG TPA: S41 family peptidase [Flavobacteriales bacterium]|nr:S41 family peptidase [Flavobacteriales bacterium]HHZ95562.1 S41 family peptidase [Flavobacteriales bacterium]